MRTIADAVAFVRSGAAALVLAVLPDDELDQAVTAAGGATRYDRPAQRKPTDERSRLTQLLDEARALLARG